MKTLKWINFGLSQFHVLFDNFETVCTQRDTYMKSVWKSLGLKALEGSMSLWMVLIGHSWPVINHETICGLNVHTSWLHFDVWHRKMISLSLSLSPCLLNPNKHFHNYTNVFDCQVGAILVTYSSQKINDADFELAVRVKKHLSIDVILIKFCMISYTFILQNYNISGHLLTQSHWPIQYIYPLHS